jgi:hypothetical protein
MILPLRIFGQTVDTLCQFMGIAQIILTPICGHLSCMQVFNWLLELIQARKSWIDHPIQQVKGASGLLFVTPEKTKSQGVVQSQGLIHCYSAGSSGDLAGTVHNRLAPLVPLSRNIHCLLKCYNTHSHTDNTDVK